MTTMKISMLTTGSTSWSWWCRLGTHTPGSKMQEMNIAGKDFATFGTDEQQSQPNKAWINTSKNNILKSHWLVIIDSNCHQYTLHLKLLLLLRVLHLEDGDNGRVLFIGSYLGLEFSVATQRSCSYCGNWSQGTIFPSLIIIHFDIIHSITVWI